MEERIITLTQGLVELQLLTRNARLREARMAKGFKQKELSILTGIPVYRIQEIENLWFIPYPWMMEEISSALEKSVVFLFPPELLEAMEEGVFHERKVQLGAQQVLRLTETKRLGHRPLLTSGVEEIEKEADRRLLKDRVKGVLRILTPREQRVLTLRFGLEDGVSRDLETVGREFNVTRERIRQIEAKALRKLRHPARSRFLKDFFD